MRAAQAGVDRADAILAHHHRAGRTRSYAPAPTPRAPTPNSPPRALSGFRHSRPPKSRAPRSPSSSGRSPPRLPWTLHSSCNCPGAGRPRARHRRKNPIAVEQNAVVEETQAQAPRSGTFLLSALLSAGHRLRPRHRRGDQRQHPGRPEWPRAQRAELRSRLHRDFPDRRPAVPPRPRSRAVRDHPRADRPGRDRSPPTCEPSGIVPSPR